MSAILAHKQRLIYNHATGKAEWVACEVVSQTTGIARWGDHGSWSVGCNTPEQVQAERTLLESRGIKTDYTADLEPIFRDRKHRREHCQAIGYHDRNGGYSDP